MAKAIVYTKPNCMQCNFTKRYLEENEIPFETRDVEKDEQALEEVKALGFQSLPVIVADGFETFNGFHPDKLNQLK